MAVQNSFLFPLLDSLAGHHPPSLRVQWHQPQTKFIVVSVCGRQPLRSDASVGVAGVVRVLSRSLNEFFFLFTHRHGHNTHSDGGQPTTPHTTHKQKQNFSPPFFFSFFFSPFRQDKRLTQTAGLDGKFNLSPA